MGKSAWGDSETQYFFELSPDHVLDSVEEAGFRCTGKCVALNSYENRVYEVEIEIEKQDWQHPYDNRKIVKFYRPGRWSKEQILEEHEFLKDLDTNEIPVVPPLPFKGGKTLNKTQVGNLWYALFPKVGGRIPQELDDDQLQWIGRLLARMHGIGFSKKASHRIRLNCETYGWANLDYLLGHKWIPPEIASGYKQTVESILTLSQPMFENILTHRVHGDCHLSNILWDKEGPFFLDFDDMVTGPPVQDFWLLLSGRDADGQADLESLLEGYEQMRDFDRSTLRLIEPLRALRFIHFTSWIARRWKDPAFPKAFPHFNTPHYWGQCLQDLREQLGYIQNLQ